MQPDESEGARSNPVRVVRTGRVLPIGVGCPVFGRQWLMLGRVPSGSCCASVESTPVGEDFVAGACQIEIGSAEVGRPTEFTVADHVGRRAWSKARLPRGRPATSASKRREALEASRLWASVVRHGPLRSRLQRIRRRTRLRQSPPAAGLPSRSLSKGGRSNQTRRACDCGSRRRTHV